MKRSIRSLSRNTDGAVAATVGLSLFALLAVGGVAFDYARLASMDSELQDAADQAALAAASQLDGNSGACGRAAQAAQSLIQNTTRFSNDGEGRPILFNDGASGTAENESLCNATGNIRFWKDKAKTSAADSDANANFVEVEVNGRTAHYALTPVTGLLSSSDMRALAFAGVGSAVCGVVPFFICSPSEPTNNTDLQLPVTIAPGTGIKMLEGGDQKGPGNFGFLAFLGQGASNLEEALSADSLKSDCVSANATTNVVTEPGQKESVFDGINNRFDVPGTCKSPPCSPSTNERKDLVRPAASCTWQDNPANGLNYQKRRYRPNDLLGLTAAKTPEFMGHPRDLCHALTSTASCPGGTGLIGDGKWDRAAYFRSNHPGLDWVNTAELGANVTRYQTYLWEAADAANRLKSKASSTAGLFSYGTPQAGVCKPPGIVPNTNGIDRRRLTAAAVNCHAYGKINGRKTIPVAAYIDIFLVEPSKDRTRCDGNNADADLNGDGDTTDPGESKACKAQITNRDDIYIEVIGASGSGQGGGTAQITRRDIPYLIE